MNIENGDATFDSCQFINNQGDQVREDMRAVTASLVPPVVSLATDFSIPPRCQPSGKPLLSQMRTSHVLVWKSMPRNRKTRLGAAECCRSCS